MSYERGKYVDGKDLKFKPLAQQLKGVRTGPACVRCNEPIDVRIGASVANGMRGSKQPSRNGFLHNRCEEQAAGELLQRKKDALISRGCNQKMLDECKATLEIEPYDEQDLPLDPMLYPEVLDGSYPEPDYTESES